MPPFSIGGGHKNASGCSAQGELATLQAVFERKIAHAIEKASGLRAQGSEPGQA